MARLRNSFFPILACLTAAVTLSLAGGNGAIAQSIPKKSAPSANPLPSPPLKDDEPEVVRVETDLVNSLFTAVDRDRHFITTLQASDIAVFENNVPQVVSLFERETDRPLSLVILVDTSESQRGVLQAEKDAARAFVDAVIRPDRDQAAIVSFTGVPRIEQSVTNNLDRLHAGIRKVRIEMSPENERRLALGDDPLPKDQDPSGYTGIWDAMLMSIQNVLSNTPDTSRRAIILLSDGDDTSSSVGKQDVIDLATKANVIVYSIGLRDQNFPEGKLDAGALRKVSDRTGGRAFLPGRLDELPSAFSQIEAELRSQYLMAYSPTNKNRDGSYRRIRIEIINPELRKQKAQLVYREGYYAKKS